MCAPATLVRVEVQAGRADRGGRTCNQSFYTLCRVSKYGVHVQIEEKVTVSRVRKHLSQDVNLVEVRSDVNNACLGFPVLFPIGGRDEHAVRVVVKPRVGSLVAEHTLVIGEDGGGIREARGPGSKDCDLGGRRQKGQEGQEQQQEPHRVRRRRRWR